MFNSVKPSSNLSMKKVLLPKDFTVLILLTVSLIKDPINFYDLSDLVLILLIILTLIDVAIMRKGVKASVIKVIFQQLNSEINKPIATVVELRVMIATIPVIML